MTAAAVPAPDALLAGVRRGLALAAVQDLDPGWQAVGLVLALQGALALALTAYDTADPGDVLDRGAGPGGPARLAPVSLLLRRAGSPDWLSDPERLVLSRADRRALEALMDQRNRLLHPLERPESDRSGDRAGAFPDRRQAALKVLRHLLLGAPAFDPSGHALDLAAIGDLLRRLEAAT